MTYITIPNQLAYELADCNPGQGFDGYEVVENRMVDTARWESIHELVIRAGGNLYRTHYRQGLTESQDTRPFEWDGDLITFKYVVAVKVETFEYKEVA